MLLEYCLTKCMVTQWPSQVDTQNELSQALSQKIPSNVSPKDANDAINFYQFTP